MVCQPLELGTGVVGSGYWTATSVNSATSPFAWSMDFLGGHEGTDIKGLATYVRGVRRADL